MQIVNVRIQNYGSLKDVSFKGESFVVFVGPNGQGKSLLFEALHRFFIDFNSIGGGASVGVTDILWYRRDTTQPITFELELELNSTEARTLLPFSDKVFQLGKKSHEKNTTTLSIKRSLTAPNVWNTDELAWEKIPLINNNSITTPEKVLSLLPEGYYKRYKMHFFTQGNSKDNIGGDRILVDSERNRAFMSHQSIDELVRRGVIESSTEFVGKNWQEWCKEGGLEVSSPTPADISEILLITPEILQQVINNLTNLRGKFILIPASRDVKATPGQRLSLLDPPLLQTITSTAIDRQRSSEIKWEQYRGYVENFLGKRLEPNPTQILLKEGDLGLLPAQTGGGEQAVLGLIWETMDANAIIALEEPENHLHPALQRQMLRYFQELAPKTQILICTHSAIFASKPSIDVVYSIFKDEQGITRVEQVNEVNIYRLIDELGVRSSDIFDFDTLVFVEGDDDVKIFKAISKQFIKSTDLVVEFVNSEGWNSMAYYANARVLKSRKVKVDIFAVFDGDTEADEKNKKIKERLISDLKIEQDHIITLKKHSIESYLLIPSTIKRALPLIRLSEEEIDVFFKQNESKKNKKEVLDSLLRRGGIGSYTGELGAQIAQAMREDEIDQELKEDINKFIQPHK